MARARSGARVLGLVVLALCAIPLFLSLVPFLAPIFSSLASWNTALLGTDTGNLNLNALMPWFALASIVAALATIALAAGGLLRDTGGR